MLCVILREEEADRSQDACDWLEQGHSSKKLKRLNVIAKISDLLFVDMNSRIPIEDLDANIGAFCRKSTSISQIQEYLEYLGGDRKKLFGFEYQQNKSLQSLDEKMELKGSKDQNSLVSADGHCWLVEGDMKDSYTVLMGLCAAEYVFDWHTIQQYQDTLRAFPLGGVHLRVGQQIGNHDPNEELLGKREDQGTTYAELSLLSDELLEFIKTTGSPLYISLPMKLGLESTKNLVDFLCKLRSKMEDRLPLSDLYFLKKLRFGNTFVTPLRPQSVMLSSEVYRSFEADIDKYVLYGRAIRLAVDDFEKKYSRKPVLALIGAGRGCILMQAVENYQRLSSLVVVEKNIGCKWLLESRLRDWASLDPAKMEFLRKKTSISFTEIAKFSCDLGDQNQWDIVVSEMLGCFGCDEQAPEVLFSIPTGLVSKSAIFIPTTVTALLQPVQIYRSSGEKSLVTLDKHPTMHQPAQFTPKPHHPEHQPPEVITLRWCRPLSPAQPCFTNHFPVSTTTTETARLVFGLSTTPLRGLGIRLQGGMHSVLYESSRTRETVGLRTDGPGCAGWGGLLFAVCPCCCCRPAAGCGCGGQRLEDQGRERDCQGVAGREMDGVKVLRVTARRVWGEGRYEMHMTEE